MYKVFQKFLGRDDLLVNLDRGVIYRPTVGVGEEGVEKPEWRTDRNLHLDMNPWDFAGDDGKKNSDRVHNALTYHQLDHFQMLENNYIGSFKENPLHLQAQFNLLDNLEEDGGLTLVPAFHKELFTFVELTKSNMGKRCRNPFVLFREPDPMYDFALRVTSRAGSLIIWQQTVVHGSSPNHSGRFRYAQFIKMFPAELERERKQRRRSKMKEFLQESHCMNYLETPLSRKLYGLEDW